MTEARGTPLSDVLLAGALVAGVSYFFADDLGFRAPWLIVWKGAGVGLLALWAFSHARRRLDGWWIGVVLAAGAAGDVLLETHGMAIGGITFLIGHVLATVLYLKNRRGPWWLAVTVAAAVALASYLLPAQRDQAPGIALYGLGVGAMAGSLLISRFASTGAGLGALLFTVSDLLIFAGMGPLAHSPIPAWGVWPLYFVGQLLIALGVVDTLRNEVVAES